MGFSTAFGPAFFFRMALPGLIAGAFLYPFLVGMARISHLDTVLPLEGLAPLAASSLVLGLAISGATRGVYLFYRGFERLPLLTGWRKGVHEARAKRLQERQVALWKRLESGDATPEEVDKARLIAGKLQDYPIAVLPDGKREYRAERPTMLGNIIAAYQRYPRSRYGFDGIFYWHHAVSLAPSKLVDAINSQEPTADGMVLASAASGLAFACYALVALLLLLGQWMPSALPPAPVTLEQAGMLLGTAAVLTWVFYAAATAAHREYAKLVKAAFDLSAKQLASSLRTARPEQSELEQLRRLREHLETLAPMDRHRMRATPPEPPEKPSPGAEG